MPLFAGNDEIIVPAIFDLEVASALVRRGTAPASVTRFFQRHFAQRTLVTIGPRVIRVVRSIIDKTGLRAADALYVWLAVREGLELVTSDRDVLSRAPLAGASASSP